MKRLILAVLVILVILLGACASPPATIESQATTIKTVNVYSENMDVDADLELVVEFTLANDKREVVVATGKVTYVFLYSTPSKKEVTILTKAFRNYPSDLPIYFDREDFRVACPTCEGTGFVTCSTCKGTGEVKAPVSERLSPEAQWFLEKYPGVRWVGCPRCGGSGKGKCPDEYCNEGILDLSGAPLSLIVKFEREDGVTLEGRNDSVLLP